MNKKHPVLYFLVAIIAIFAMSGFVMLEITNTMTDFAFAEASLYNVVTYK